ncbi:hypothetical protein TSOC_010017 [Tetrabaena socialis]|uniref:Protein TolB n=1 Tax=Tetrabaena socialis TaxID=47790 RepID=A0A2J7ZUC6_9CHLO|nr:hypothetical protein TSOC_010017 [Tetrabaena socialis]|eukprot:PNH03883.1 hypothetical protein TSOC_010017 [Tetrabaena socialis]
MPRSPWLGPAFLAVLASLSIQLAAGAARALKGTATVELRPSPELLAELQQRTLELAANVTHDPRANDVGVGEVRRITNNQKGFHMSGYFDKSPWSVDGSMLLLQRTPQYINDMQLAEALQIAVVHLGDPPERRTEFLTNTTAWNHQQGTMLQWLGNSNNLIVYNTRVDSASSSFQGVIFDVRGKREAARLPMPVYSLDYHGTIATSLNFGRLFVARRDYGYVINNLAWQAERSKPCPEDDGIWVMEGIRSPSQVKPRLLISISAIFNTLVDTDKVPYDPSTGLEYGNKLPQGVNTTVLRTQCTHWINHAQLNREGTKVLFLYRIGQCGVFRNPPFMTYPFTIDVATKELWRVPLARGSHHDFGWHNNLISCDSTGYFYAQPFAFTKSLAKPTSIVDGGDGHCSFAPTSNEFLLSDTYPTRTADFPTPTRTLFTWDLTRNRINIIGHYAPVKEGKDGISRVDLHPRWSRDGRYVCFDSTHEGVGRQVYIAKVYAKALARTGVDVVTRAPLKLLVDFGALTGGFIANFLQVKTDATNYIFHALEGNPDNYPNLRATLGRLTTERKLRSEQIVLVEAAAGIMDSSTPGAQGAQRDASTYLEHAATYIDHVVCKLAGDRTQYEVLAHLIRQGTIILCDAVHVKWSEPPEWAGWSERLEGMLDTLDIPVMKLQP